MYRLQNSKGSYIEVSDYGAIFHAFCVADKDGVLGDIVLGHEKPEDIARLMGFNGATIGRCINRIADGALWIGDRKIQLETNFGGMTFHGGSENYGTQLFQAEMWRDGDGEHLSLYHKDRGESEFPGCVDVWIIFTLTETDAVEIVYKALPTEDTILNISNHVYFNLAGHGSGTAESQVVQIDADFYLPGDNQGMATGEVLSVEGTPFDLREPKPIGEGLASDHPQIVLQRGYDHNFCVRRTGYRKAARAYDCSSGRVLTVYTDMPGVHFYTGNNDMPGEGYKYGATYVKNSGYCFETQYFPNTPANAHFPNAIFPKNQLWTSKTTFQVSIG